MHNWVRFYVLENNRTENFDYKGFTVKRFVSFFIVRKLETFLIDFQNIMAALKFTWDGLLKRAGSILIGTSPEFDMALYTMCFLSRRGRETCDVSCDFWSFSNKFKICRLNSTDVHFKSQVLKLCNRIRFVK